MDFVYVVIEPEVNPVVFATFADAKASVIENYREELEFEEEEAQGWPIASDVDVLESASGVTHLYIEKGINIYIYRLPIIPPSESIG
jgi:hypothetical protein